MVLKGSCQTLLPPLITPCTISRFFPFEGMLGTFKYNAKGGIHGESMAIFAITADFAADLQRAKSAVSELPFSVYSRAIHT